LREGLIEREGGRAAC